MTLPWHFEGGGALVRKVCVGAWETNVYVVACTATGAALVVDAGDEAGRVLAAAGDVSPVGVVATHGHHDHVDAAAAVAEALDVPFLVHADDDARAGIDGSQPLREGPLRVGELTVEVLHTPGHTPGSVCLVLDGAVLTGDTLFPGGPGSTGDGSFPRIIDSVERKLFTLDPTTLVLPGHGLDTTIGTEAPSLERWRARGW